MDHPVKHRDMQALADYQRELSRQPKLRFLFIELTDQCNLNCLHCGSGCSGAQHTYLETDAIYSVMQSVAAECRTDSIMICLTGGEPMLHPDIYDIIEFAKKLGFPVGMTSNATLIDEKAAVRLAVSGLDTISISIDGLQAEHDAFRKTPGAFERALTGFKAFQKVGIYPQAFTVVHHNNFAQLNDIYQLLLKMNVDSWRLINMEPIGRAMEHADLLLNAEEIRQLLYYIRDKRFDPDNPIEVTFGCSHFLTFDLEREVRDFYFQCGAGLSVASIRANGDIGACLDIMPRPELIQGNIAHDDFLTVWKTQYQAFRTDRTANSKTCSACKYRTVCMGDSTHTWDFEQNEPGYCFVKMWGAESDQ